MDNSPVLTQHTRLSETTNHFMSHLCVLEEQNEGKKDGEKVAKCSSMSTADGSKHRAREFRANLTCEVLLTLNLNRVLLIRKKKNCNQRSAFDTFKHCPRRLLLSTQLSDAKISASFHKPHRDATVAIFSQSPNKIARIPRQTSNFQCQQASAQR